MPRKNQGDTPQPRACIWADPVVGPQDFMHIKMKLLFSRQVTVNHHRYLLSRSRPKLLHLPYRFGRPLNLSPGNITFFGLSKKDYKQWIWCRKPQYISMGRWCSSKKIKWTSENENMTLAATILFHLKFLPRPESIRKYATINKFLVRQKKLLSIPLTCMNFCSTTACVMLCVCMLFSWPGIWYCSLFMHIILYYS